jgi:hypothetical protein
MEMREKGFSSFVPTIEAEEMGNKFLLLSP